MKSFIVFALVLATALAAPQTRDGEAQIVRYVSDNIGTGPYNYEIETSNGIQQAENGDLRDVGTENEALEVSGRYSYPGLDGVIYTVTYTAGKNGFVPEGAHLPQNP